ncbi:GNAT family N-acetyltransferase [Halosquirtibacter laminarini]|uniref:GNAT family N-acetyltransferase n=1 Tax=Halosquirtibacter laminarini TaxID=3374600 RepID=A0AC61NPK1_9BACT|nr:GNAT family N-acetyltransferase [Prolixibacteraceae bacterium]
MLGKGIATKASIQPIKKAEQEFGVKKIIARTYSDNSCSIALISRLGFQQKHQETLAENRTVYHYELEPHN